MKRYLFSLLFASLFLVGYANAGDSEFSAESILPKEFSFVVEIKPEKLITNEAFKPEVEKIEQMILKNSPLKLGLSDFKLSDFITVWIAADIETMIQTKSEEDNDIIVIIEMKRHMDIFEIANDEKTRGGAVEGTIGSYKALITTSGPKGREFVVFHPTPNVIVAGAKTYIEERLAQTETILDNPEAKSLLELKADKGSILVKGLGNITIPMKKAFPKHTPAALRMMTKETLLITLVDDELQLSSKTDMLSASASKQTAALVNSIIPMKDKYPILAGLEASATAQDKVMAIDAKMKAEPLKKAVQIFSNALIKAKQAAERIIDLNNLRQMSLALIQMHSETGYDESFDPLTPDNYAEKLVEYKFVEDPKLFHSKFGDTAKKDRVDYELNPNISFPDGFKRANSLDIILWLKPGLDPKGGAILFADGHARTITATPEEYAAFIKAIIEEDKSQKALIEDLLPREGSGLPWLK